MAHQTEVLLLFILTTAATSFGHVVKPVTVADLEEIVEEVKYHEKRDTCTPNCPFGWVKFDGRCFSYQDISLDWVSAENHCLNLGANLVSIHSENEYQLVKVIVRAHDPSEKPTWIGLSNCQKRNNWFWSDGTKLTFTKWNPNEPNFTNKECCAHLNWSEKKDWNDIPCDLSYPFVCVKRLPGHSYNLTSA